MAVCLRLLGGFEARLESGLPLVVARRKSQALLAYLALQPGHLQPRDKLAALLWGDASDERARHSLRQALLGLRQALPRTAPPCLIEDGDAVTLNPEAADVDVPAFERLIDEGTPTALERAIALYRGDLLEGLAVEEAPFEQWLLTERERLRERAVEALAKLLAYQTQAGLIEPAVQTAVRLLGLDPVQEAVHRALMRLYARQGRRGAALRQYQACVSLLERELGVEPETETKQLYQALLQARPRPRRLEDEPRPTFETPLVGREAELGQLRRALDEAWQGRGTVAIIQGEAGIGKSRLVEALLTLALDSGHALVGRAHESEQVLPFSPWVDALRAGHVVPRLGEELPAPWKAELARLFPELGAQDREPAVAEDYLRLFEAMAQVVQHLAASRPLLIVLENVHWADEMSHRLLVFLSRRIPDWPVLIVVTVRSEELADAVVLRRSLSQLARQARIVSLPLSPLSETHTLGLVRALAKAGTEESALRRFAGHVWRTSEGNPFMVIETVRALPGPGALGMSEPLPTPPSVRELVASRLDRLSDRGRRVVGVASVIGREFDFSVLHKAGGLSPVETAEGVEELVGRRILHVVGERLDFTHDRIREVAYDLVLPPHRKLLHGAVAQTLEELHVNDLAPHALALGRHYSASEAWERAWPYLARAGANAAARSAHREAVACFEQALTALGHVPPNRDLVERSIDLRFEVRQCCVPLGDYSRILTQLREAEAAARSLDDRRRLGWVLTYRTHGLFLAGQARSALESGGAAVAVAEASGDGTLEESANFYLGQVHYWLGNYHHGAELLRRNVSALERTLAARALPMKQQVNSRTFLAWCLAELGEFEDAIAHAEAAIGLAEQSATAYHLVHAYSGAAMVHLRRGAGDQAVMASERAVELCRGRDFSALWVIPASILASAWTPSGRAAEAITILEQAAEMIESLAAPVLGFLAAAYLATGRTDEARAAADRAIGLAVHAGERGWEAWALHALGAVATADDPATAEDAYRGGLSLASALGMRPLVGHCHLGLGSVYRRLGKPAQAREQLTAALTTYHELNMPDWTTRAEAELTR